VQRALKARDAANTDDVERLTTLQAGSCVKPSTTAAESQSQAFECEIPRRDAADAGSLRLCV
jgi:hypothetical protein